MAEEQEWHEASNHVLCANNCGFFGSPTTLNLCSKCYKNHCMKEQQISKGKLAVEKSLTPPVTSSSSGTVVSLSVTKDLDSGAVRPSPATESVEVVPKSLTPPVTSSSSGTVVSLSVTKDLDSGAVQPSPATETVEVVPKPQQRNRCGCCNRRVGLTAFACRCGTTFCGTHRYPEFHDCTFDFKAIGKEAIAKANPVVKAAKLDKI